jgi:hypothetical protein
VDAAGALLLFREILADIPRLPGTKAQFWLIIGSTVTQLCTAAQAGHRWHRSDWSSGRRQLRRGE